MVWFLEIIYLLNRYKLECRNNTVVCKLLTAPKFIGAILTIRYHVANIVIGHARLVFTTGTCVFTVSSLTPERSLGAILERNNNICNTFLLYDWNKMMWYRVYFIVLDYIPLWQVSGLSSSCGTESPFSSTHIPGPLLGWHSAPFPQRQTSVSPGPILWQWLEWIDSWHCWCFSSLHSRNKIFPYL